MKKDEFMEVVNNTVEDLIKKVLIKKGEEYTRGNDRFSNFKRMAAALGCTPEKALVGAWIKHIASILDMVDDLERMVKLCDDRKYTHKELNLKLWDEKIGDAINYLILLRALIIERNNVLVL